MAQNYYGSNKPVTLQDLLAQANSQPDAPTSAPAPPSPSQIETPGVMNQQDRQKILDMLLAPDSVGPEPEVDKTNALSLLFTGLGDAINAGVAASTQNPGLKSNTMDQYLQRINNQKEELRAYKERKLKSERDAKHRTANYLLSADDRAREDKARLASQQEARAYQEQKDKAAVAQHVTEQAAKEAADLKRFNDNKAWDLEMEKTRFSHDQIIAGIKKKSGEGDDVAKHDQKALPEIISNIGGLADVAKERLAAGDTPESMQTRVRRMLDAAMLSPEARKAAENYYDAEVGPILREHYIEKQNSELAAGSPDARMGGGPGLLQQMGSVRVPQKF